MAADTSLSEMQKRTDAPPSSAVREDSVHEDQVSVLDLLIVLAERKYLVLKVAATFAIFAIMISLLLPKKFTAMVTLLPPQQGTSMASALASQLGSLGGMAAMAGGSLGIKNPNDMYVAMLKSRTVEDAMVQRYGLAQEYHTKLLSDAAHAFETHSTVDGSGKDGLIHVSVTDLDPIRAAELANGYIDQYRNLSEHLAITEASQRRLFFEQQLEQEKDKLADAEEALKKTEQQTGLIQLDSQTRALIESAATLRAQIAAKEVQIESLRTFATNQNSQLVQAQQELESLRAQLTKLGGDAGDPDSLIMPKGKVPEAGLEYVRRLRDVKYQETIFDILARQFEVAKLDEAKQGALIQVVDPAIPPDHRSSPKRGLIVVGATVLGFFIGVLAAFVQAGWQRLKADPGTNQKLHVFGRALAFRRKS